MKVEPTTKYANMKFRDLGVGANFTVRNYDVWHIKICSDSGHESAVELKSGVQWNPSESLEISEIKLKVVNDSAD